MAISDDQIAEIHDLFEQLGPIDTRKMFGGLGIYCDGAIFALLRSDGALLLKGVGDMPAAYEAEGWQHWTYTRKSGVQSAMPYWETPEDLRDSPDLACDWARRALAVC